jgi:6-phosphogluconolactonase
VTTGQILPAAFAALLLSSLAVAADSFVYVGTFTKAASRGIYGYRFDEKTGKLRPIGMVAKTSNPTFLRVHPDQRYLYAVNEDTAGKISAFLIDPRTGKLNQVNQVSAKGDGPCHLALDREGRWLAVANYASGSIAVFPLRKDGGLGEASAFVQHRGSSVNPQRQAGPHAHAVVFSPDNRFLLAADLGLDKILAYRFDAVNGTLTPADPPFTATAPGAGPRHLIFHPNGKVVYAINEMASTVTVYQYDATNAVLTELQAVPTPPPGYAGANTAAEIAINSRATMVYASDRGADALALLLIDPEHFTLSPLEYTPLLGRTPRHFALDPTGAFLIVANQDSDSLSVFKVHPRTGQIQPVGRNVTGVSQPTCVVFAEPGQ